MDKLGYLDTLNTLALGIVFTGLVAAWFGDTTAQVRKLPDGDIAITQDGRMKLTVTAEREVPKATVVAGELAARS